MGVGLTSCYYRYAVAHVREMHDGMNHACAMCRCCRCFVTPHVQMLVQTYQMEEMITNSLMMLMLDALTHVNDATGAIGTC